MKPAEIKNASFVKAVLVLAVLFWGMTINASTAEAQSIGVFRAAGNMTQYRSGHTATLLSNGKLLLAGGRDNVNATFPFDCGGATTLSSTDLFDSSTGTAISTGAMTRSRDGHTATLLANGKVLIVGGERENLSEFNDCQNISLPTRPSAELYDSLTGSFTFAGNMTQPRHGHTATLLRDGSVLIAGAGTAELYDPSAGSFTATNNMTVDRSEHTATLLDNGKVLIAGGYSSVLDRYVDSAELYDPVTRTFNVTGKMTASPFRQTATLLRNGKVLVAGGSNNPGQGITTGTAQLYDPSTGIFTATGSMSRFRYAHTASLLPDGTVLIAGGAANGSASAELYDPNTGSFSSTGNMNSFRSLYTASVLTNGTVLLAGGYAGTLVTATQELYDPNSMRTAQPVQRPARDFNHDGRSDILWRDTAGNVSMWLLSGYSVDSDSFIANIWPGWRIAGSGDIDGDGKSDILWRDTSGNIAIWLMDGSRVSSFDAIGNIHNSWAIAGVADFNGDGKSDILWRNTSGDVAMWLMDGFAIVTSKVIASIWMGWSIAGTGDFDGDGKSDILWRDFNGHIAVWLMDGNTVTRYDTTGTNLPQTYDIKWRVSAVADFDGDGRSDILWRNTSGDVAMWLMNGTTIVADWPVAVIHSSWTIAGACDFNGDGAADVLWRDSAGSMAIWLMDGTTILSYSSIGNVSDRIAQ